MSIVLVRGLAAPVLTWRCCAGGLESQLSVGSPNESLNTIPLRRLTEPGTPLGEACCGERPRGTLADDVESSVMLLVAGTRLSIKSGVTVREFSVVETFVRNPNRKFVALFRSIASRATGGRL